MKFKLIIATAVLGTAGCFASLGMAAGGNEALSPDDQALVINEYDRLHIEAPVAADLAIMNVRVFGPDNELLLEKRTQGESVEFLVGADLADGEYRYETVSVFGNVDLRSRENYVDGEKTVVRKFGSFTVENGQIVEKKVGNQLDEVSLIDKFIDQAVNLAGATLDFLIPSANAQDLTSSGTAPSVYFNDTQDSDCSPIWDWRVKSDGGTSDADTNNSYIINGVGEGAGPCGTDVPVVTLFHNGSNGADSSANSLLVDADGDIHWANGGLNFDRGLQQLSIGTTATGADLYIASTDPTIRLYDDNWGDWVSINNNGFDFVFGYTGTSVVRFNYFAGEDALVLTSAGNLGVGVVSPVEQIHAAGNIRTDGYFRGQSVSPGFWIDETGAGNKGANVVLDGGVLQIQRRAQGFGGFEASIFRVNVNGPAQSFTLNSVGYLGLGVTNASFPIESVTGARLSGGGVWQNASSRELKENIHDLDSKEAMAAFKALEPVVYNYKVEPDDSYIGFIAEDVPELVASKDRKTLSSMDIVALLTRVVQDQQSSIEEKELRIEALEKKLESQSEQFVQQQAQMAKLETMIRTVAGLENPEKAVAVNQN